MSPEPHTAINDDKAAAPGDQGDGGPAVRRCRVARRRIPVLSRHPQIPLPHKPTSRSQHSPTQDPPPSRAEMPARSACAAPTTVTYTPVCGPPPQLVCCFSFRLQGSTRHATTVRVEAMLQHRQRRREDQDQDQDQDQDKARLYEYSHRSRRAGASSAAAPTPRLSTSTMGIEKESAST